MPLLAASLAGRFPLRRSEPLAGWTTLRIGGPAETLFEPARPGDLAALLDELDAGGVAWRILGAGANTLAPDGGVAGAVVATRALRRVFREGDLYRAWAGATLPSLVHGAAAQGLGGLERLVGVPGNLGGALAMNAGTGDWGIWELVEEVTLRLPGGEVVRRRPSEVGPRYRDGNLRGAVVLEAVLRLCPEAPAGVRERMAALLRRKNATQPVTEASAGCAFRNPPGDSAGRLIEAAGLKGARQGRARISEVHANFVLNEGGATAAEVRALLARAQTEVAERFGVRLEREMVVWPEPESGPIAWARSGVRIPDSTLSDPA